MFKQAIQRTFRSALNARPELPSEPIPAEGYEAIDAIFDTLADELSDFSHGSVMIGHTIDPAVGGHIEVAAALKVGGLFPLFLRHATDTNFQFPIADLLTSANGFPATLYLSRENPCDPSAITCMDCRAFEAAVRVMISELKTGLAINAIMNHTLISQNLQ